jgi:hypothetical protein
MNSQAHEPDRDPRLTRLFRESVSNLPDVDFVAGVLKRIESEQRTRRTFYLLAAIALFIVIALCGPWLIALGDAVVALTEQGLAALEPTLSSPLASVICGGLTLILAPLLYVRILR